MDKIHEVGIIGGGVSGAVIALQLADLGVNNILFEKETSVVNGPPFCHLHAGGNLYPDISDEQCRLLMSQSIEMARLFPESIDKRPTLISIPKTEKYEVEKITGRLEMLRSYYQSLIDKDPLNEILGSPKDYYTIYSKEELMKLKKRDFVKNPTSADQWVANGIQLIDHEKLKMPVVLVQEYGWNLFRLAAQAQLALKKSDHCTLQLNTQITQVKDVRKQNLAHNWELYSNKQVYKVKYLVNACGYNTGEFDDNLNIKVQRMLEFKAAYVTKWKPVKGLLPELVFHGKRGTENGMAQLTPYCDDYYQIHGMTKQITLFEKGLIESTDKTSNPEFNDGIKQILKDGWQKTEATDRTKKSIEFVAKFVPSFESATVGGSPLYGAQQIPGKDPDLRVGEVSFATQFYARSEIVKASSALTVAHQIIENIQKEGMIPTTIKESIPNELLDSISKKDIDDLSLDLTAERGYPKALSRLLIEK